MLTADQIRDIAERAAEKAAERVAETTAQKAADKAVRGALEALGVDLKNIPKEQKVWAFARTMQQGSARGVMALVTGFFGGVATLIAGALWYFAFKSQ